MTTLWQFALIGLGIGAIYVLVAQGLVLVYRGSGIVNLAHGAIGMVGTYLWWEMRHLHDVAFVPSLLAGLLASAALGAAIYFFVMRPLRGATAVTRVIASLAVLVVLQSAAGLRYSSQVTVVPSSLPTRPVTIFGASIGLDQLLILGIVTAVTAVLWISYRYTRFGLATSAVAENRRSSSALGISPDLIASVNWALSGALTALAGILLVPLTGLASTSLTLLIVPALAAALVGNLSSFPLTMLGGLLVGVAQSWLTRYVPTPGWSSAAPFVLVVIMLVVRGSSVPGRGTFTNTLPRLGAGRVRPSLIIVSILAFYVLINSISNIEWVDAISTVVLVAIILLSIVVLTGYTGQLSLAQMTFAGLGALMAANFVMKWGLPFLAALALAAVAIIPIGLIVGLTGVRTRGVNLAIVTLMLAQAADSAIFTNEQFVGITGSSDVGFQSVLGIDISGIMYPERYAMFALLVFVVVALAIANLRRGRVGRALLAVRANERAAESLGVSVPGIKLYAFALSAVVAAIGGVLLAFRNPYITYDQFNVFSSIYMIQNAIVGSVGWIVGPLIGGNMYPGSTGAMAFTELGTGMESFVPLIGGVLLLLTLLFAPDGVAHAWAVMLRPLRAILFKKRSSAPILEGDTEDIEPVAAKTLRVTGLSVAFGGVQALRDVTVEVGPGEVVGLIGSNGAGKTTLIDTVTGFVRPTSGSVVLDDQDILRLARNKRLRAGLGRSFQGLELFDDMTVQDNLLVGAQGYRRRHLFTDLFWPGRTRPTASMMAAVREFKLTDVLDSLPSDLGYGQRRLVAIARSVAAAPSVLLLDEPAAGLDEIETKELSALIKRLATEWGVGILLIEHHVGMVMEVCDRAYVLEFGEVIASGTTADLQENELVVSTFLGTSHTAATRPAAPVGLGVAD